MTEPQQQQQQQSSGATQEASSTAFTQKDVDRAAGTARKEGRQAAENAIAESLGVSVEEAKKIIADHRAAEEANRTEIQKITDERDALKAERDNALKLAETRLIDAEMRSALIADGVPADRVKSALKLAARDGLTVADDGAVEGISEAVEALKGSDSYLFQAPTATAPKTAPDVNTPQPDPLDVSKMTSQEFAEFQGRIMAGEMVAPPE